MSFSLWGWLSDDTKLQRKRYQGRSLRWLSFSSLCVEMTIGWHHLQVALRTPSPLVGAWHVDDTHLASGAFIDPEGLPVTDLYVAPSGCACTRSADGELWLSGVDLNPEEHAVRINCYFITPPPTTPGSSPTPITLFSPRSHPTHPNPHLRTSLPNQPSPSNPPSSRSPERRRPTTIRCSNAAFTSSASSAMSAGPLRRFGTGRYTVGDQEQRIANALTEPVRHRGRAASRTVFGSDLAAWELGEKPVCQYLSFIRNRRQSELVICPARWLRSRDARRTLDTGLLGKSNLEFCRCYGRGSHFAIRRRTQECIRSGFGEGADIVYWVILPRWKRDPEECAKPTSACPRS